MAHAAAHLRGSIHIRVLPSIPEIPRERWSACSIPYRKSAEVIIVTCCSRHDRLQNISGVVHSAQ